MYICNQEIALEPCPYCGSAELRTSQASNLEGFPIMYVHCLNCGCFGPGASVECRKVTQADGHVSLVYEPSPKKAVAIAEGEAIAMWNERAYNGKRGSRGDLKKMETGDKNKMNEALNKIKSENPQCYHLEKLSWALMARVYRNTENVAIGRTEPGAMTEDIIKTYCNYLKEAYKLKPKKCAKTTLWYALEEAAKLGIKNKWFLIEAHEYALFSQINELFACYNALSRALRILTIEDYASVAEVAAMQRKKESEKNWNDGNGN